MKEKKFNLIEKIKEKAKKYKVNIRTFLWIYFGSMFPVYGGAYIILHAMGVFNIKLIDLVNFRWLTSELSSPMVLLGLTIHLLGWISPYVYIAIAGKGLKPYIRAIILIIGIFLIVALGGFLKI